MSGGSVRDRIRAAEALQRDDKNRHGSSRAPTGHKLSLKTDEHIREEFLRRGDGGWSKNVDIGQQQPFTNPPSMPFIKVTSETPVVSKPKQEIPAKISKDVPGAFEQEEGIHEPVANKLEKGASGPSAAEQRLHEKQLEEEQDGTREVPIRKFENLLDEHVDSQFRPAHKRHKSRSRSRSVARGAYVEDTEDPPNNLEATNAPREKVIFRPNVFGGNDEVDEHYQHGVERSTYERRRSYHRERNTSHTGRADTNKPTRSRSSGSWNKQKSHEDAFINDDDVRRRRKHSSRSSSAHAHEDPVEPLDIPPSTARRSSHSLWPSFSQSERRSLSDFLETTTIRPRSSHSRSRSDTSVTSKSSELSGKTLEFAEYIAGKKVDHVSAAPLRPPSKPMGFVRSRSSTGEYSEHFTREKALLRKPDEGEEIAERERGRHRREHHYNQHDPSGKYSDDPWQVKILQGIAKM